VPNPWTRAIHGPYPLHLTPRSGGASPPPSPLRPYSTPSLASVQSPRLAIAGFILLSLTMHWLMPVAAGLLSWRNGSNSRAVHIIFVVDKVALGQSRLPVIRVCLIAIIPPLFHTALLIYCGRRITLTVYSVYVCSTHTRENSLNTGNLRTCAMSSIGMESS